MAVLFEYQGQGLGKELLLAGEKELQKTCEKPLLWFNARESAVDFYSKFGYSKIGEPFMIPNVCVHIVMFRFL